jgi:hypothetical protein
VLSVKLRPSVHEIDSPLVEPDRRKRRSQGERQPDVLYPPAPGAATATRSTDER